MLFDYAENLTLSTAALSQGYASTLSKAHVRHPTCLDGAVTPETWQRALQTFSSLRTLRTEGEGTLDALWLGPWPNRILVGARCIDVLCISAQG